MGLISRLKERGNIPSLIFIAGVRGIRDNLRYVIWQPYVLSLGLSMQRLGNLESLMDLSRILVQPVLGAASDKYGRKRFLILREFLMLLTGVCLLLARGWLLLGLSMILVGLNWALLSVWNSMVAESSEPSRMGSVFSLIGSTYMGLGLVGTLLAGYLAENFGYSRVFILFNFLGITSLILVWRTLDETIPSGSSEDFTPKKVFLTLISSLKPSHQLRGFYIAMGVDLFAFSLGWRLLNGMLTESYGYTPHMLGIMSAVMTGSMAVFQLFVGRYADRIGYSKYLAFSQILSCIFLGIIILSKNYLILVIGMLLMGLASAFWAPAEQAWIANNVNPSERAQALGSYATFRGLVSFPAPSIGGYLYDLYGFNTPIILNLILAFINSIMILLMVKEKDR